MKLQQKLEAHRRFWAGKGPSLLLIPPGEEPLYDVQDYIERLHNPGKMLKAELNRTRPVVDWPTDGIPTIRPNLGVVFIPAIMGQGYIVPEGQMPCRAEPLSREVIQQSLDLDVEQTAFMRLATDFYRLFQDSGVREIAAYHPDTQGVFDIAHLVYSEKIFFDLSDDPEWIKELLEICLEQYVGVTSKLKETLSEGSCEMIHGHGTSQGVYFPGAGARISEDTVTLLSPKMIESVVFPYMVRSMEKFGGGFVHFCGRHPSFFDLLCDCPLVRAIDLGNSELYDCEQLLLKCAETDTVLYSRLAAQAGESWREYVVRIGGLVKKTGARCILRPLVFPEDRASCAEMLDLWRSLTG